MNKKPNLIKIKGFKEEIPFYFRGNINSEKCIFFVHGLGGSGSPFMRTIDQENLFNDYFVISLDMRGQTRNKNKPSKFSKRYIKDLKIIINFLINKFGIKNLYLLGESWGSALIFLYLKYVSNPFVKGAIGWNMPYSVTKNEEVNKKQEKIIDSLKVIFTFLTNITTWSKRPFNNELTNNPVIIRINSLSDGLQNNKLPIASFFCLKKAWRYLKSKQRKENTLYIQSMGDILRNNKIVEKYKDNIVVLESGTHILSLDIKDNLNLFEIIKKTIS
ncbi:MAG: alpha/beta fold hydrolase [Metamycoplasmataceae bacterium]